MSKPWVTRRFHHGQLFLDLSSNSMVAIWVGMDCTEIEGAAGTVN
jgi:hypothetical protein